LGSVSIKFGTHTGLDGAFREVLRDMNVNVDEPTVGVVVQFNSAGEIKASNISK
jgi:hypothetical protein